MIKEYDIIAKTHLFEGLPDFQLKALYEISIKLLDKKSLKEIAEQGKIN